MRGPLEHGLVQVMAALPGLAIHVEPGCREDPPPGGHDLFLGQHHGKPDGPLRLDELADPLELSVRGL